MDKKEALKLINELIEIKKRDEPLQEVKAIFDQIKTAYTEPLKKSIDETKEFLSKANRVTGAYPDHSGRHTCRLANEKGVHPPEMPKSGTSGAGYWNDKAKNAPNSGLKEVNMSRVKTAHKQILDQIKSMPKPNLPKSEDLDKATGAPPMPALPKPQSTPKPKIAKMPKLEAPAPMAKVDPKTRLPGVLLDKASEHDSSNPMVNSKGVHPESYKGTSPAGFWHDKAKNAPNSGIKEANMSRVKDQHKKILNQIKSMSKPNLPKSEDLTKDGSTASAPASRLDAGFGKVIIKNDDLDVNKACSKEKK